MLFVICSYTSHTPKFWQMHVITYSDFMIIVESCKIKPNFLEFRLDWHFQCFSNWTNKIKEKTYACPKQINTIFNFNWGYQNEQKNQFKISKLQNHLTLISNVCFVIFFREKGVNLPNTSYLKTLKLPNYCKTWYSRILS